MSCIKIALDAWHEMRQYRGMFKNTFYMLAAAAIVAPAFASVEWMTDLDAAKAKAVAENKPLLIDFTGSDWCTWCIKLKQDVLSAPDFEQFIAEKFIPVEIDVPQNAAKVGGEEQLNKNRQICDDYGVEAFPTVMVVTPEGHVAGGIGYSVEKEEAQQLLNTALVNVETLEKAKALQGVEKAKLLLPVYVALSESFAKAARSLRDEIVALDPQDELGMQQQVRIEEQREQLMEKLSTVGEGDYAAAIAVLDDAIQTALPENADEFRDMKINLIQDKIYMRLSTAQTVEDVNVVKDMLLNEFIPAIPEEDQAEIKAEIEKNFADPEVVLQTLTAAAAEQEVEVSPAEDGDDETAVTVAANELTEEEQATLQNLINELNGCANNVDAMLNLLNESLTDASPAVTEMVTDWKISIMLRKMQLMLLEAETEEDVLAARDYAMTTIPMLREEEREEAANILNEYFEDPAALLEEIREQKELLED